MEDKGNAFLNDVAKKMEYRFLGRTGMQVSVIGFGNWVNNVEETKEQDEATIECIKA